MLLNLPFGDHVVHSLGNAVGVFIETQVTEKHRARENESGRVSLVLALDVETDVTATGLENGDVATNVASGNNTGATNKGGTNVGQDTTVQVRHDHHVELLRPGDSLHGGVVDDHVVGLESGVILGDLAEGAAEKTVCELHDVGLVDTGDLLAVVCQSKAESKLGDALRLGAGDDLQRLDDALDGLVLQAGVLSLGVLTDDAEVDIVVSRLVARDVLDQNDRGVDVELLAQSNVERLVTGTLDRGVQNTLETELVALQRGDRLLEQLLGMLVAGVNTAHVDLLPLNWYVVGLEDGLDGLRDFGTNAIT